ncbi:MAG: glutamine--tRNA ligase/YqeY domain fusion protein, partial [Planctomycetota bacterium]|nr:glutamine--tRNA ligase/YqeY domain fusion protein [Planctomycetota bacterium]
WLGFQWDGDVCHTSDYYSTLHEWAVHLIQEGKAYVDEQTAEEMRASRGSLTEPGTNSPFRDRPVEENLDLFEKMRVGELEEGACVLRAKIDMSSPNLNLRDPALYRILKKAHPRTGDEWCIYPMYDFAHGQSDAIEGITHSLCSLEFENHRPLYDWFVENLPVPHTPRQIEFSRLNLTGTVMSKRKLLRLVEEQVVEGWDDPRMPTLSGLRRRGFTPTSIRDFIARAGVTKTAQTMDLRLLQHCLRQDLEHSAERRMAVLNPLKVVLTDYPEGKTEEMELPNHTARPELGKRKLPFSREFYIEQSDFLEDAPKKFFRLTPGKEVKLRYAYVIKCEDVIKDEDGNVVELHCTHDPDTRHGLPKDRKVKGILHWVPAQESLECEVRLYDELFSTENPDGEEDFMSVLNPDSLKVIQARCEPSLLEAKPEERFQFERNGYFAVDVDSKPGAPVFNRSVSLKDSFSKK